MDADSAGEKIGLFWRQFNPAHRFKRIGASGAAVQPGLAGSYVDILVKRLLIHFPQLEFTFYNRGVGGDTIRHLLERYSHDIAPLHPTMMILWIGQNDAKAPEPAAL